VVLDKTGTLTQGKLSVAVEHYFGNGESCLSILWATSIECADLNITPRSAAMPLQITTTIGTARPTLTQGKLSVAVEHYFGNGESCLSILSGLVGDSKQWATSIECADLNITPRSAAMPLQITTTIGTARPMAPAHSIEVAHKASHVVLDKTGTLTQGKLSVAVEH
jgi:magnesium-transporting ATPase (P-type)